MLTIFEAKRIITMDPSLPTATHIAVKEGRVLGVGPLEELKDLGEYRLDQQFADKYIYPGLGLLGMPILLPSAAHGIFKIVLVK